MQPDASTMNKRIQWILGISVFIISFIVYFRSVAPTTSFWDCGEFIACSYILGVMHPPGAPLYLLIGRLLTMLPIPYLLVAIQTQAPLNLFIGPLLITLPDMTDIGLRVNLFSVFVSAATVMFTFLVIVQLIRRWRGEAKTLEDRLVMYVSGLFGAMAFAFTDSFWFNAVEAEVYALSMFFTALVVWLALYWGERSEKAGSLLLIFFIFYMFGLATGVHLLNILVFPFVLLLAFFHHNQTVRRLLLLLTVQAAVPILIYVLFFQFNPAKMGYQGILDHQATASNVLKWFGLIWIVITMWYMYNKDIYVFKIWWIIPVLFIVAYSTYLIIYIRANLAPPINENDPSTVAGMMDYLARKQYGTEDLLLTFIYRKASFWSYQIQFMYTRYFGWQFIGKGIEMDYHDRIIDIISFRGLYGIPFLVGLWGAVHHFFRDWKRALAVFVLFFLTGYAIILYVNQPDPQPRERDYSYVGSFFAFALWIGIGMAGLLEQIGDMLKKQKLMKHIIFSLVIAGLFFIVPYRMYAFNQGEHSRAGNYVAYDYSYNILQTCEPDAIIFTNGDNDTFPLWFLQEVYGIRKDVRVVNLSLLNTHWYIKQLRDEEPKVPIGFDDDFVKTLYPQPWTTQKFGVPVSRAVQDEIRAHYKDKMKVNVSDSVIFQIEPTFEAAGGQGIRVQDIMVMYLLHAARWKRPLYFAVTVSPENLIGLHNYLRMDGLAFKVVPYTTRQNPIDPDVLKENLLEKYQYRGLDDEDVFFNTNIIKLLQNYRSAFRQLAMHYLNEGDKEEATFILDEMSRRIPADNIPYSSEELALVIADLYKRLGRLSNISEFTENVLEGVYSNRDEKLRVGSYYTHIFENYERGEELLNDVIRKDPGDVEAIYELYRLYRVSKQYDKAILILEELMALYPRDRSLQAELEALKQLAAEDTVVDKDDLLESLQK